LHGTPARVPDATTLVLVRHGMTDAVGRALAGRSPDVHLNAEGREQAARLAQRLTRQSISAIYSSPLARAVETAAPIAAEISIDVRPCDAAVEIDFGEWTGRTLIELASDPRWEAFNRARSVTAAPEGESIQDVQSRIVREIERICVLHRGETIVLVTHADVIRAALCHYAGVHLDSCQRFDIDPASLTTIEVWEDGWVTIAGVNR
jgi:probable phosphomutase (TIGR03848 family)